MRDEIGTPTRKGEERTPRAGSGAIVILAMMRKHPAGSDFSTGEVATLTGLPMSNLATKLQKMADAGWLFRHPGKRPRWSLLDPTTAAPTKKPNRGPRFAQETFEERAARVRQATSINMIGRLRDMFFAGDANISGQVLRLLADAMDAARAVIDAKGRPGCRFKGAEVEAMVARELRQISEAAQRATSNLRSASEFLALTAAVSNGR